MTTPTPVPTQVKRPWRATFRTAFQFVVAFAVLLPFIVDATGLEPEVYPWLGGALAIAAALTRVMALPQVEAFLQRFAPFLAAAPRPILGKAVAGGLPPTVEKPGGMRARRTDDGRADVLYILGVVALIVVLLALVGAL